MRLMESLPQREGEPPHAYAGLLRWARMGMPSPAEMEAIAQYDRRTIAAWQQQWEWQQRVDESPIAQQAHLLATRLAGVYQLLSDQADASGMVYALIKQVLTRLLVAETTGDDLLPPSAMSQLATLLKATHDYERLRRGEATEIAEVRGPTVRRDVIDAMDPDELWLLRRAMPSVIDD